MRPPSRIAGICFCAILFFTSLFGVIFMLAPALPLVVLKRSWYRKLADEMVGLWLTLVVALLELVYEVKVKVTGDIIKRDECAVIIMNHRTRLDWLFFWTCLWRHGYTNLKHEKIILKHELKVYPGPGWAMQCGAYIFLKRKWQEDEVILKDMLGYFRKLGGAVKVLIFPEGTDYNSKSFVRSQEYAASNGLKQYNYVLQPRTTGFKYIVEQLSRDGFAGKIYDVTVGYPFNIPQNEAAIARGEFPEEIVYAVTEHNIHSLGADASSSAQDWCQKRWDEKESNLEEFYATSKSPQAAASPSSAANRLLAQQEHSSCASSAWLVVALVYWLVFIVLCATLIAISAFARYYALVVCLFFLACTKFFDGFEFVQSHLLDWHN